MDDNETISVIETAYTALTSGGGDPDSIKIGARNNARDAATIQGMHDLANELGAKCPVPEAGYEPKALSIEDTLVSFGGEVKALGDGKVGGQLVRFTTMADLDLTGDFFAPETDYGSLMTADVYYNHGLDAKMGKRRIGSGKLTRDELGYWIEAQLNMRDDYEKAIYQMAADGKLGWSSGTAGHLVERQTEGKGNRILAWPLGLDASLTPTPAEPRNIAVPLKSLMPVTSPDAGLPAEQPTVDQIIVTPVTPLPASKGDARMDEAERKEMDEIKAEIAAMKAAPPVNAGGVAHKAPGVLKLGVGDTELKATAHFIRTGDNSGLKQVNADAMKASNAIEVNITTTAQGLEFVPTGHYAGIIARRDPAMLAPKLGVMKVPGVGTTVLVPVDGEADGEFIATAEGSAQDLDFAATDDVHMTLAKYTKKIVLSQEIMEDTDFNLMTFIENFVGRGLAKTHNAMLVTAASSTTSLKTFATASTIAFGSFEDMVYGADIASYLDDSGSVAWVTSGPNYAYATKIVTASPRAYTENPLGGLVNPAAGGAGLVGFPVYFSNKVTSIAASAKSFFFGNWSYMGYRDGGAMQFLRDPYSNANLGELVLRYYFRAVYAALQTEAIGYGVHPTNTA